MQKGLSLPIQILITLITISSIVNCSSLRRSEQSGYAERNQGMTEESDNKSLSSPLAIKNLEKRLKTQKEKEQYSKVLPWLKNDDEKLDFLALPSYEDRQAWIREKKLWNRANEAKTQMKEFVEEQDILLGMPQDLVKKAWGDPQSVEVSGNPIYKNERWKYVKNISSPDGFKQEKRYVYFEGGKVVGWETE